MASLVLGAAGAFVGNMILPGVGGAIGWSLGSMAGSALFPPKGAPGPRLSDLKVQTSQYGKMIPLLAGNGRIAGNIIWSDPELTEHENEGGGKGGPAEGSTFTYTISFAVQIGTGLEGPLESVRRIWAFGELIYDATEVASTPTTPITSTTLLDPYSFTSDDWNYHVRHPETWPLVEVSSYVNTQRNAYSSGGISYDAGWSDVGYAGAFLTGEGTISEPMLTEVPFTFYPGDEEQGPDSTMEAVEGVGNVPGYRGTAYVVFNTMDVTKWGAIPALEFEFICRGVTNSTMRTVKEAHGQYEWAGGFTPAHYPVITSWPIDGTSLIRVREIGTTNVKQYNQDLSQAADGTYNVGDYWPTMIELSSGTTGTWQYRPAGAYVTNGLTVYLYGHHDPAVGGPATPLSIGAPAIGGSGYPEGNDICESAGVPVGELYGGSVTSQDGKKLFVFTAPSGSNMGSNVIDKWYEIVNSVVVDQGTVDPPLPKTLTGYGRAGLIYNASVFENNGKYMWRCIGSDPNHVIQICSIGADKVFAHDEVAWPDPPALPFDGLYVEDETQLNSFPSVFVPQTGYCGIVVGSSIVLATRTPVVDATSPTYGDLVAAISAFNGAGTDWYDTDELTEPVTGYVIANQMTKRAAIEPLMNAGLFDAREHDDVAQFVMRDKASIVTIPDDDLAAHHDGEDLPALLPSVRGQEVDLPAVLSIVYPNPATDYQPATQVAKRMVMESHEAMALEMAIVMDDAKANRVVWSLLMNSHLERTSFSFATTRKYAKYEPCDVITARGRDLRITRKVEQGGLIRWNAAPMLRRIFEQDAVTLLGDGGAAPSEGFPPQTLTPPIRTSLLLLDIPLLPGATDGFGSYIVMGGATAGDWPGATLYKSTDGGTTYASVGTDVTADIWGATYGVLGNFEGGNVFDESNIITVILSGAGGTLSSATELAVLNGANVALIGNEVIQFKNAELTASRTYELSGLLRGRLGTEWAISTHSASETFVLLHDLTFLSATTAEVNLSLKYKPVTFGQSVASATEIDFINTGVALRPLAPVHLGGGSDSTGTKLKWIRRSRLNAAWTDGGDVPLSEDSELYVVQIWDSTYTQVARIFTGVTIQEVDYTNAMQVTDFGDEQQIVFFTVNQIGRFLGRMARGFAAGTGVSNDLPITPLAPYSIPAPPTGTVNMTLTWPDDTDYTSGFNIGDTYVASFTTGGGTPGGYIVLAEYVDPPTYRHAVISTDAAGTDILAHSYGNTVSIFFGAGLGYANLSPSTTYYFVVRCEYADGTPSGTVGAPANAVVQLNG